MNGLLLAFMMSMPMNSTWDPETEYLPYGESVIIRFIDVKIPMEDYYLGDCDTEACEYYVSHDNQLEDLDEPECCCTKHGPIKEDGDV